MRRPPARTAHGRAPCRPPPGSRAPARSCCAPSASTATSSRSGSAPSRRGSCSPIPTRCARCSPATPRLLHAGKANLVLRPFLGHALGAAARRPAAPAPAQADAAAVPRLADGRLRGPRRAGSPREHVAAWPRGDAVPLAPRLQAITLDVVLRVIFGVGEDSARLAELRERLRAMLGRVQRRRRCSRCSRSARAPSSARVVPALAASPSTRCSTSRSPRAAARPGRRRALAAARRARRGRRADERPRAARRARHAARRRPRDDRDGAELDGGAVGPHPGRLGRRSATAARTTPRRPARRRSGCGRCSPSCCATCRRR